MTEIQLSKPEHMVSVRDVFGIDTDLKVPAFTERDDHVPEIDEAYRFNPTEVQAGDLVRNALLREYRERLNKRIADQGINIPRLARMFAAILAQPRRDGWLFGEEEGHTDGRRLSQLVSSPTERRLFRQEQYKPAADCVVTFWSTARAR